MNRIQKVLLVGLVVFLGETSSAAGMERVAVLEFKDRAGLSENDRDYLVDVIVRGAVREALPVDRYVMMNKENMITLLEAQGLRLEEVCEGSCEVDVGKKIGAHYIVTGSIWKRGALLEVTVKLFETKSGNLRSQKSVSGADLDALSAPAREAVKGMVGSLVAAVSAPSGPTEEMVLIPGGTFWMGCVPGDSECEDDEKPRHQVTVDSFHMDTHEVTQAQYERVMGKNPSNFKNCSDCPVENVSWDDARSYCSKVGKRLPTEAEWEYAARGGKDGEVRHGSLGDVAWYDGNSEKKTHPVGKKAPNGFGLYDMLGNVYEWCSDWYDEGYYAKSPLKDPHGAESGASRVLRGGSWYYGSRGVRASYRYGSTPDFRTDYVGFRCVRDQ